ncbi:MAG TPA: hypothetical protein HPP64_13550 [Gammaproteobacteria bacterium]|jgi:hypothetical protein|nr:hypothetical protein [Gammaproteobacteria bacterium]HIJ23915.1 hypothetical protein [Gammaproteobacteria bacterium]
MLGIEKPVVESKPTAKKKAVVKSKLVRMVKGELSADVHPDEVENFKLGDWVVQK